MIMTDAIYNRKQNCTALISLKHTGSTDQIPTTRATRLHNKPSDIYDDDNAHGKAEKHCTDHRTGECKQRPYLIPVLKSCFIVPRSDNTRRRRPVSRRCRSEAVRRIGPTIVFYCGPIRQYCNTALTSSRVCKNTPPFPTKSSLHCITCFVSGRGVLFYGCIEWQSSLYLLVCVMMPFRVWVYYMPFFICIYYMVCYIHIRIVYNVYIISKNTGNKIYSLMILQVKWIVWKKAMVFS